MKNFIKNYFPFIYAVLVRIKSLFVLLRNSELTASDSYFAEYADRRYSRAEIFIQQCKHIMKYGHPNDFYFLYGLDIKGMHCADNYVDYGKFMLRRDFLNSKTPNSPTALLRNKFLFGMVAKALNIPTPNDIGIIEDGYLSPLGNKGKMKFEDYVNNSTIDTFLKTIDGECADGVYSLKINNGDILINGERKTFDELSKIIQNGKYLLQEKLTQHNAISKIYSGSINTIRLETVYNVRTKKIEILPPLLRVGTGVNKVDNWAVGGLAIGIDTEHSHLRKYGFYKPSFGTKTPVHPNSGVVFDGYEIPFLQESIRLAKLFHSHLTEIHSIGWDIAITENGPCFIEGNDNWEISLVQICSHGLQNEFNEWFV